MCLEKLGEPKKAVALYRKGLRINYDYGPLHLALVELYGSDPGKEKQRKEHLEALKILKFDPPGDSLDTPDSTTPGLAA